VTETARISHMLGQLDDNASSYIFWDGFDCVYQHGRRNGYGSVPPNDWVFWFGPKDGTPLIEYIPATQTWKPRKQFYEHAQLMKFIKPGSLRIGITGQYSICLCLLQPRRKAGHHRQKQQQPGYNCKREFFKPSCSEKHEVDLYGFHKQPYHWE
jgi:hypothetical protein